ncbi:TIGR03032 family protein [Brevundimonas sp.]|uniref:TIGR03032 family protein n=1 Tax=Brevundimonas sp. TaxID=1871086 RepID=UPI003D0FA8F4
MRLSAEFVQLNIRFDADALAAEIAAIPEAAWRPHPEGHAGNSALPLVALNGDPLNDGVRGAMAPTSHLTERPYLRQVLAALDAPIGRTRLMRIDGDADATLHVDLNVYWQTRMRIHIPIVTTPDVLFVVGDAQLHMAPGEAWIFDTWHLHNVINPAPTRRIHLVIDTEGSGMIDRLISTGRSYGTPRWLAPLDPPIVQPGQLLNAVFETEAQTLPVVADPQRLTSLSDIIRDGLSAHGEERILTPEIDRFLSAWALLWEGWGPRPGGWRRYADLIHDTSDRLASLPKLAPLSNGLDPANVFRQIVLQPALNTDLMAPASQEAERFDRPVFIVSSPRSGSSLLFETLARARGLMTIGGESHAVIEGIDVLHPASREWSSNRLDASDAAPSTVEALAKRWVAEARDRDGKPPVKGRFRFLEKTPKNSLRIPFLKAAFPDARFVYLFRDERATLASMMEAWRSGRFVTYPQLPHWPGRPWSLLLPEGWREWSQLPLPHLVAEQWRATTQTVLDDLAELPADDWCVVSYDRLVEAPEAEMERLCTFLDLDWDQTLKGPLPASSMTLTPPSPDKWKSQAEELKPALVRVQDLAERARGLFAREPRQRDVPPAEAVLINASPAAPVKIEPFASSHTSNFPELLAAIGGSLVVSTYQSGRVVLLRAQGERLNTHFSAFASPMGMAFDGSKLAIASLSEIWDYRNTPAAAERLHPPGHDACFLPRNMHVTGDIRVHEIAFGRDELWVVNTRFSTLCTLDAEHSFVPRWRPAFVSRLAAEDRCHLNGLAMVDDAPRYATALGVSDVAEGWRANKSAGGVIIDISTDQIVVEGLSMPHSPRIHLGSLWVLESARGELCKVDLATGARETIAALPGFARGLAFHGPYAFVGLSQVREDVFADIPLGQRLAPEDRACGIWVVDVRDGATLAWMRFEGEIQEIFDVQMLPNLRLPDIQEPGSDLVANSIILSDDAMTQVG